MKISLSLLPAASAIVIGLPAQAATACSVTDISPQAAACAGFYDGNLLNNNAANVQAQKDALASLGLAWDGNFTAAEKLTGLNGSHTVDFASLLNGTTYVGMHFGNGQGGPGQATAFYRFEAGTNLDTFTLAYNASSNVVLYATGPAPVPEPGTYAMLLAGLGFVGLMTLRRSR
ncbi:PEP-CTERM sorting domain-containing protein [Aquincola sp. MAHUQ-54]|uniref:PEP-CTERM sorting domain-containing protein n=1 Tax=Aquincola agrisoli TaxID=3119538 RepID=A0AAW9QGQ8_9BURK